MSEDDAYLHRVKAVERWSTKHMVMTPNNTASFAGLRVITEDIKTGVFMCFYGIGGGGKTTMAADVVRSPYGGPALLVSADKSYSSVVHLRSKGLTIIAPDSWDEVQNVLKTIKKGDTGYKSVIWDNLSEILRLCILKYAPTGMPEGPAAIKLWGQITAEMLKFTDQIRSLTLSQCMNVFCILWEETEKDELTQRLRYKMNLTPRLSASLPGMITMIGRITVPGNASNNYIRKLSFAPSETTDAKFRVAPTEAAAKIPVELWVKEDSYFIVDFLSAVNDGVPFPTAKYADPTKARI